MSSTAKITVTFDHPGRGAFEHTVVNTRLSENPHSESLVEDMVQAARNAIEAVLAAAQQYPDRRTPSFDGYCPHGCCRGKSN
jgi:hypothetical protein